MNATVTAPEVTAPAFLSGLTNVLVVWKRVARSAVSDGEYSAGGNTCAYVADPRWAAGDTLGYAGQGSDGTWVLIDAEGWLLEDGLHNRGSAKAVARRTFGPVIVA